MIIGKLKSTGNATLLYWLNWIAPVITLAETQRIFQFLNTQKLGVPTRLISIL